MKYHDIVTVGWVSTCLTLFHNPSNFHNQNLSHGNNFQTSNSFLKKPINVGFMVNSFACSQEDYSCNILHNDIVLKIAIIGKYSIEI